MGVDHRHVVQDDLSQMSTATKEIEQLLGGLYGGKSSSINKPSIYNLSPWLHAFAEGMPYPESTGGEVTTGKWCIFAEKAHVDNTWAIIRRAVKRHQLWRIAKVSTAYRPQPHIICVYTPDWQDVINVVEIRNQLKLLGFRLPLSYKRDIDTINGKYGGDDEFIYTI